MIKRGIRLVNDPIRVTIRIAGAPVRPASLASIGESLSQAIARRLMTLPPPADRRSVQGYLIQHAMPRVVVEPTRQNIVFEFHDPDGNFGVSRNACAHWFELTASLNADDYAMLASRAARTAVRLELPGISALLHQRGCKDLVALDGQFFWACRSAPELWGDGTRRPLASLSAPQRTHVEQVRRGGIVDCAFCSTLVAWQSLAVASALPEAFLRDVDEDRMPDLLRLLPRLDGGRHLLARVVCAAVRDPNVASSTLSESFPSWLLQHVRGTELHPGDLGEFSAWYDRMLDWPLLPELFGRLLRGASRETSDILLDWAAQALLAPATRSSLRSVLTSTLESGDALEPAAQVRLEHMVQSSQRGPRL